jgi:hypothetical protein
LCWHAHRNGQGMHVFLRSDPSQTGVVTKRDGKRIRVDFGYFTIQTHELLQRFDCFGANVSQVYPDELSLALQTQRTSCGDRMHKQTLDFGEIEPLEVSKPKRPGQAGLGSLGSIGGAEADGAAAAAAAAAAGGAHPRVFYDDASRAAQEAADAALARRLAMLPPGEELPPAALQEESDAALARSLASMPAAAAAAPAADNGSYQPGWGERPDPHQRQQQMQELDFDSVGETAWGLHGAVPLMRAVGRVLNEMHRPVEVYKVRKSPFVFEPLALFINAKNDLILPRQARDKHKKG